MRLHRYIKIFGLGILLASCDNGIEFVTEESPMPEIVLLDSNGESSEVIDTRIKLTLKNDRAFYEFSVSSESANASFINIQLANENGVVTRNGEPVGEGNIEFNGDISTFRYEPAELGNQIITVVVNSELGRSSVKKTINVEIFENELPVADFEAVKIGLDGPYHYELDASNSFDADVEYGGFISYYNYRINGVDIQSSNKITPFNFGKTGSYEVILTVYDGDGGVSEPKRKIIEVN